jgi:DNA topoisomerase-1
MKANIVAAVDAVAARLGNTRAVCRSSYIHPAILAGYEHATLCGFPCPRHGDPALDPDEQWTLEYLKSDG